MSTPTSDTASTSHYASLDDAALNAISQLRSVSTDGSREDILMRHIILDQTIAAEAGVAAKTHASNGRAQATVAWQSPTRDDGEVARPRTKRNHGRKQKELEQLQTIDEEPIQVMLPASPHTSATLSGSLVEPEPELPKSAPIMILDSSPGGADKHRVGVESKTGRKRGK